MASSAVKLDLHAIQKSGQEVSIAIGKRLNCGVAMHTQGYGIEAHGVVDLVCDECPRILIIEGQAPGDSDSKLSDHVVKIALELVLPLLRDAAHDLHVHEHEHLEGSSMA